MLGKQISKEDTKFRDTISPSLWFGNWKETETSYLCLVYRCVAGLVLTRNISCNRFSLHLVSHPDRETIDMQFLVSRLTRHSHLSIAGIYVQPWTRLRCQNRAAGLLVWTRFYIWTLIRSVTGRCIISDRSEFTEFGGTSNRKRLDTKFAAYSVPCMY